MTRYITEAALVGYHPGNDSTLRTNADYTITEGDFRGFSITERVRDVKDTASVTIQNNQGVYSDAVRIGDRVEVFERAGSQADTTGYGEGGYGVGPYGGGGTRRWVGMISNVDIVCHGSTIYTIDLKLEDFGGGVMGMRRVNRTFENTPIAGPGGIINEILSDECPELNTSQIPEISQTASVFLNGNVVLDVVADLALRAGYLLKTIGKDVTLIDSNSISPEFVVTNEDVGTTDVRKRSSGMVNDLQLAGATAHSVEELSSQTTVDGFERVTDENRIVYQIQTRKDSLSRIEIWTQRDMDSDDSLVVRLQYDVDGSPIDVTSRSSDISQRTLSQEFISVDDWTTFIMPEHTNPEPFPWLIIEAGGDTGHDVGINTATDNPGVIPHYPYDIVVDVADGESADEYRRREDTLSDDSLQTFEAANGAAEASIADTNQPDVGLQTTAESPRAHDLGTGDVMRFEWPTADAVGNYVVEELQEEYDGPAIETTLSLKPLSSIPG